MKNIKISLSEGDFLAKGFHKKCYIHPENSGLCVKIAYKSGEYGDGQKEFLREIKYMNLRKSRDAESKALPKYYGEVETNFGKGVVYELVRDYNGAISQSLAEYFGQAGYLEANYSNVKKDLMILKENMYKDRIITSNLFPANVLYRKDSEDSYTMVIIDDLGSTGFIPIEYYISFFAEKKILRKWHNFSNKLQEKFNEPLVKKLVGEII